MLAGSLVVWSLAVSFLLSFLFLLSVPFEHPSDGGLPYLLFLEVVLGKPAEMIFQQLNQMALIETDQELRRR